jgi:hypothetical protein
MTMAEVSRDQLGPVDYVVEFPAGASSVTGRMAAELRALADSGAIRVIDALILTTAADGTVEAKTSSDIGELGELQASCTPPRRDPTLLTGAATPFGSRPRPRPAPLRPRGDVARV